MGSGSRHTQVKSAGRWARGSLTTVAPCEASGFPNLKEERTSEEEDGHRQRPHERAGELICWGWSRAWKGRWEAGRVHWLGEGAGRG